MAVATAEKNKKRQRHSRILGSLGDTVVPNEDLAYKDPSLMTPEVAEFLEFCDNIEDLF